MTQSNRNNLDELLSGYLDGELDASENRFVEELLAKDDSARRSLDELRRTVEMIRALPRRNAPASVADDLVHHLERAELLDASFGPPVRSGSWIASARRLFSAAAMLALVVLGGWWVMHDATGGGASTKSAASSSQKPKASEPVADASTSMSKEFEAVATFAQKLALGMDEAVLRRHQFGNEKINLTVASRDVDRRDRMVADVLRDFRGGGVTRLGARYSASSNSDGPVRSAYFEGKVGINFTGENKRVVLVHASGEQLQRLLARLGRLGRGSTDVSLAVDSAKFKGSRRARSMLAKLAGADVELASSLNAAGAAVKQKKKDGGSVARKVGPPTVEDLLRQLGLHPELAEMRKESDALVDAHPAAPIDRESSKIASDDGSGQPRQQDHPKNQPPPIFMESRTASTTASSETSNTPNPSGKDEQTSSRSKVTDAYCLHGFRPAIATGDKSSSALAASQKKARSASPKAAGRTARESLVKRRIDELERVNSVRSSSTKTASADARQKVKRIGNQGASLSDRVGRAASKRNPRALQPITLVIEFSAPPSAPSKPQPSPKDKNPVRAKQKRVG